MKKYIHLFILFVFAANISTAQNRSINFNQSSFKDLLATAKKENKMIFIDCFTTWCGPCKYMSKNIFTNDSVADFYNQNFINAKIDMEKGEGIDIAKKFKVQNYPTMLYLKSDGTELHRVCGSSEAKEFIQQGKIALDPDKRLAASTEKFNGGKVNADKASQYFSLLDEACLSKKDAVTDYFNTVDPKEFSNKENWAIIEKHVNDYYTETFQMFEAEKEKFSALYTPEAINAKLLKIYSAGLYSAVDIKDMSGYETMKEKLTATKSKEADKIILEADIYKAEKQNDWNAYAQTVIDYMSKYSPEEANELNNYAWTFYEKVDDVLMLNKAEGWAKTACELDNTYANNDTYAAVLYKLGKKKEATLAANKAIAIAKENQEDFEETEALLVKIATLQ